MPAVSTNDLKKGMSLNLPEGLFQVVDFQHVKPGKGGAFVRTTLRNMRNGAQADRTFRADERLEQAIIDKRDMQFLYRDGDDYVFMDNESYDQLHVTPTALAKRVELHRRRLVRHAPDVRRRDRRVRPPGGCRAERGRDRAGGAG